MSDTAVQQAPAQPDWFAANAPKAAAGGDWFSANAPKPVANTTKAAPQPSLSEVLTQPTEKTDKEYLGYTGPSGVAGATIHGMNNVARGVGGALRGIYETGKDIIENPDRPLIIPDSEGKYKDQPTIAEKYNPFKGASEIPGAIRDINASPDPMSHYLDAAQDTAAEGAGQALTALGTEGLVRGVARVGPPMVRLGARSAEAAANQKLVPLRPILNINTPADEAAAVHFKVPGRDFGLRKPEPVFPSAPLGPEAPPTGEFVDTPPVARPSSPPTARGEIVEPKLLPESASGASRRVGGIAREDVSAPDENVLAGRQGVRVARPAPVGTQRLLPAGSAGSMVESVAAPPKSATPIADTGKLGDLLNEGLGGKIPEGHTPVKSSAIRSYKYDPATKEFEASTASGTYIHGDVSPEQVEAFEKASSKGKAWSDLKNNSTYVGKIVNGERVAAKPPRDLGSASPEDLAPEWGKALADVKAKKAARIARPN